ncbi:TetR/AcrR family transcriptional regulator [Actinomadura xylanilytica]|uniref:TetR/AcrR family transcriptional regulator n=1 Tax=Actinomadura xylanilytica TaxID=887459 RepID=UPI00255AC2A0|nr:TetR/AcrR family transcriptional regulator [Actinomadura xylanilytica]MDL4775455.1 TetR/AcrR family transcriptional regulator [Actinomadura xylanilytica]
MPAHDDGPSDSLTSQGRRTRAALVEAAETVFARRGYARARIGDVTDEAGVSVGTFYSYFTSKEAIFADVAAAYRHRLRTGLADAPGGGGAPAIRDLNLRYLDVFAENPRLWRVMEEAALSMPELRPAVAGCRREFTDAALAVVARASGAVPDAALTALALTAMSEQCAVQWFTGDPPPPGARADAAGRLTEMWARMLGIGEPA